MATAGKLALVGVAESCDCACGVGAGVPLPPAFDPLTTPAHPLPIIEAASTIVTNSGSTFAKKTHGIMATAGSE